MKLIREGMEGCERLEQGAGRDEAEAFVSDLFANAWSLTATTPAQLYATPARIAGQI